MPAKFGSAGHRYVVTVDLRADNMLPGHKIYERVKWCFEHTLPNAYTFIIQATNPDGKCVELELPADSQPKKIYPACLESAQEGIEIPDMSTLLNNENMENWKEEALERYEWLGMVACRTPRIEANGSVDPFVSIYSTPEPFAVGAGSSVKITGMIKPSTISSLVSHTREYLKIKKLPWASVTVWGFLDSPISWQSKEHGYLLNGENHYTFIVYPNGSSNMSTAKAAKRFKLQVNIVNVEEEKLAKDWSVNPVKRFLLLTEGNASLLSVRRKIENMFAKLYPNSSHTAVARLRDASLCELDDDFKVAEVFDESNVVYAALANNPMNKTPNNAPALNKPVPNAEQQKKRKQTQNEAVVNSPIDKQTASTPDSNSPTIGDNTIAAKETPEPQPKKKKAKKKNQKAANAEPTPMEVERLPEGTKAPQENAPAKKTIDAPPQVVKNAGPKEKSNQPENKLPQAQKAPQATAKKSTETTEAQNKKQPQTKVVPKKGTSPIVDQPNKQATQEAQKKNANANANKAQQAQQPQKVEAQAKGKKGKNTPPQVSSAVKVDETKPNTTNQQTQPNQKQHDVVAQNAGPKAAEESQQNEKPAENKKRKLASTGNNDNQVTKGNGKPAVAPQAAKKDVEKKQPSQPVSNDASKAEAPSSKNKPTNNQKKAKTEVAESPKVTPNPTVTNAPKATETKANKKAVVKASPPEAKGAESVKSPPSTQATKANNKKPESAPVNKVQAGKAGALANGAAATKEQANPVMIPETPTPVHSDPHMDKKPISAYGVQMRDAIGVEAGRMMGRLLLGADEDDDEEEGDLREPQQSHIPPIIMSSKKSPALTRVSGGISSPVITPTRKESIKQIPMEMNSAVTPAKVTGGKPTPEAIASNSSSSDGSSSSEDSSDDEDPASKKTLTNVATPNTSISKASQMYTPYQNPTFSSLRQIAASAKLTNLAAKTSAIAGGVTPSISKHRTEPMDASSSSSEEEQGDDSDSSSSDESDSDAEKPVAKTPQLNVRLAGQKSKGRNKRKSALFQLARDA
ncbi:hypothetical protein K493DRAFT_409552 [Basidiobolus meristosporus CBS 931.73]|uniref:Nucleolar protein Dnt1-like N-terminal domain-containing protein n=1 Tax=Basidiobolus meristosporus CBS 931.73 TaxID=1314790 RepID=A0A1Y1XZ56_9FUNG|nr:hypothetical protein K493DRAFT_409552 [Basidiobolus meristosporus CBS 931.73]|eukprot:ORX91018.1 hypothetical protein K493DRAFT_409552 [Basidiobolus meristosporus CBS 931.73]